MRERVKKERRANKVGAKDPIKGFGNGRVEPPTQINIEEHPEQVKEPQPQREEQLKMFSQNDETSELEVSFN